MQGGDGEREVAGCCFLVKHIPVHLSKASVEELLRHYGAARVRVMEGKLRGRAFVEFPSEEVAGRIVPQLQSLELWGRHLDVTPATAPSPPSASSSSSSTNTTAEPPPKEQQQVVADGSSSANTIREQEASTLHNNSRRSQKRRREPEPIAPSLGVDYPAPPDLKYVYPPPDTTIITNIMNALIAVPKFYTQVLHLMNKLNLPPPFGPPTPTPPLKRHKPPSEESVGEAATAPQQQQQRTHKVGAPPKYPVHTISMGASSSAASNVPAKEVPTMKIVLSSPTTTEPTATAQLPPSTHPISNATLSDEELRTNKLTAEDILASNPKLLSNYSKGEPSQRLYIKNLAKGVAEDDLYFVFGRYFDSREDAQRELEVQLFQRGRMKGQAFVTFPSVEMATQALDDVHGFTFKGKPMVIVRNASLLSCPFLSQSSLSLFLFLSLSLSPPSGIQQEAYIMTTRITE
ncbi:U11/U12 small nuclear ribonucleoprotein 65 kDa protein [Balamuthia mandrillaris]